MPNAELSILVVDDAKFSSVVISRTLQNAGYLDIRTANSAREALAMIEQRPVHVLIADWLMPEMDGLQLTQEVRQYDEANNHYTYVVLLTAKEGPKVLVQAFDQGVDDFINKSGMTEQLLPRIFAADRLSNLQNRLLKENQLLLEANNKLKKYTTIDPLTGIGNRQYGLRRLQEVLKQCESRGGAACLIMFNIVGLDQLAARQPKEIVSQLIVGVARRIRQLLRPMDVIARISSSEFAIITYQPDINSCNNTSYRRIYEAMNLKAFRTTLGFISIKSGMHLMAADSDTGLPTADTFLIETQKMLPSAVDAGRLVATRWHLGAAPKTPPPTQMIP